MYLAGTGFDFLSDSQFDYVGRFGYGKSLIIDSLFAGADRYRSELGPNEQVWFVTVAHGCRLFGGGGGQFITLYDGGTSQFSIVFDDDTRNILFKRGNRNGTLVATWTTPLQFAAFDHFQFKIKIDGAAGYVIGRKNGSGSDDFTATSLNTQTTANAYANSVGCGSLITGNWCYLDDLLCFSDNGNAPNDWVGDVRAWQCQPVLDTAQKDFSPLFPLITNLVNIGYTGTGSAQTVTAGTISAQKTWSNNQGGTFTTAAVVFAAGFTGNAKLALYYGDGNTRGWDTEQSTAPGARPGHLLAVSNVLVNPVLGVNTFTFPGTVSLMNGHSYSFALLTDTNCSVNGSNTSGTDPIYEYVNPGGYADGFSLDLGPIYTERSTFTMAMYIPLITTSNAGMVSDRTPDELTSYVYSNVVGAYDLYDLFDLQYTPTSIIGMIMIVRTAKTDSGARGAKIAALSGATPFETAEFNPLTAFSYFQSDFYHLDPDTGSPWTAAAINALQMGPKVSS